VEDVEVSIFDPSTVEIGRGEGPSVEGGRVLVGTLATNTDQMSVFVDTPVTDVLSSLCLSFLVEEDDGVEVRLSSIILHPPFTRVVGILKVASKWGGKVNRLRGGSGSGDGRLVLSEADRLITVDAVVIHVRLGEVKNTRDEK